MDVTQQGGAIRVVIADDSDMLVDTLVAALATHAQLRVVATAADGPSAVAAVAETRPDVVLMDLRLGGEWGLDLVPTMLAGPHPPGIVVFSAAAEDVTASPGVVAQLDKGAPLEQLFDALVAAVPPRAGATPQS